jgi:hypothetical protein
MMYILCPAVLPYLYNVCNVHKCRAGLNHLHVPIVLKNGSLNLLEPYGHIQACNGIALPLPLPYMSVSIRSTIRLSERFIWRIVKFVMKAVCNLLQHVITTWDLLGLRIWKQQWHQLVWDT